MKYTDICEAKTKTEMVKRFEKLLAEIAEKHGGTPESHRAIQMANVGYFSGYYSSAVAKRVLDWLGAAHPIFGTAHAKGNMGGADAFNAGRNAARRAS